MVNVYDDLITDSLSKSVYDYCQTLSWYQCWIGYKDLLEGKSLHEYVPAEDGITSGRHFLEKDLGPMGVLQLLRFSMYRHPFAQDENDLKTRHPIINELWNTINTKVFDNKASVAGLKENIAGLSGNKKAYKNQMTFYDKYEVEKHENGFVAMLNARCCDPISAMDPQGNRIGQLHKDTSPNIPIEDDQHFSVLYVVNREWHPNWSGELVYHGDEYTGAKHWKYGYNIGRAHTIVDNTPGRIIVYPHSMIHRAVSPKVNAPEMTQRIAFRVRVTK